MSTDANERLNPEPAISNGIGVGKKTITILTPCYNEELNVREIHRRIMAVVATVSQNQFEHVFIDNDKTS